MDAWARSAPAADKAAITTADWYEIIGLLQELSLLKRGMVTARYAEQITARLRTVAADSTVAEALMALA